MKVALLTDRTALYSHLIQSFLSENGYDAQPIYKPKKTPGICLVDEMHLNQAVEAIVPDVRLVYLSLQAGPKELWQIKKYGLHGLINLTMPAAHVMRTISENREGRSYFQPEILKLLIQSDFFDIGEKLQTITAQESRVIQLTASGKSNLEIAGHLGISSRTVNAHKSNLITKTGFASMETLIAQAVVYGLVKS